MNAPTWGEWCRQEWPGLSDEEISQVLWTCTSFPLGTLEQVEAQFRAIRDSSGRNVESAMTLVHEQTDRAMAELEELGI